MAARAISAEARQAFAGERAAEAHVACGRHDEVGIDPHLVEDLPGLEQTPCGRRARGVGLSRGAVDALSAFEWPGSIRRLEHEMARAVLFLEDEMLDTARRPPPSDDALRASRRTARSGT